MDWFDLLKQPKLRVGSKVTTNIGSDKESEEKTPCKEQLLNYIRKVKNKAESGFKHTRVMDKNFDLIPEEIACEALKELSNLSFDGVTPMSFPTRGKENDAEYIGQLYLIDEFVENRKDPINPSSLSTFAIIARIYVGNRTLLKGLAIFAGIELEISKMDDGDGSEDIDVRLNVDYNSEIGEYELTLDERKNNLKELAKGMFADEVDFR
tara:strand:+ start:564 stop:1190 length:627 start_codon:yes stop_codon:yes gene_type:complete